MRLVAVTRILNEDDIVEAFVRHHAAVVDHHLFLDNGSVDRTLDILAALRAEGIALSVLHNTAPFYAEVDYNTNLYTMAVDRLGADWVLFLDADEFLDWRAAPGDARAWFAAIGADVECLAVPSRTYRDTPDCDPSELNVARRLRRREAADADPVTKVFVRAALRARGVSIEGGQHAALVAGEPVPVLAADALALAHYYRRNPWQAVSKAVMGHLKVLAAGKREIDRQRSAHYRSTFETIRDAPERILRDPGFLDPGYAWLDLTLDPLDYRGGSLRYTQPADPAMKALRVLASYAELLAQNHGALIDTNEGIRLQAQHMAGLWRQLF